MTDRRLFLKGLGSASVGLLSSTAFAAPLPSMPKWFKRSGLLLPVNTVAECDLAVVNGALICAAFNRSGSTAQNVQFYDISDLDNPVLLATRSWNAAMGGMCVDANGVLHIYGVSPPAQNSSPFNSIVHCTVDANWNLSAANTIIGPSGMGFNNIAVANSPLGYVLAVEQAYSNGNKAESYCLSSDPSFSSFTVVHAFYTPSSDFTGKSRIRSMPDGWTYVTTDSNQGYTKIARTQDFVNWKHGTDVFGFLGPDFGDTFPGTVGGEIFYNGNVSWEQWTFNGDPCVVAVHFQGNEVNVGQLRLAVFHGELADLFGKFSFQP